MTRQALAVGGTWLLLVGLMALSAWLRRRVARRRTAPPAARPSAARPSSKRRTLTALERQEITNRVDQLLGPAYDEWEKDCA